MTDPVPADNSADDVASNSIPAPTGKTKDFVPERTHVFALTMMALVCVIMAGWAPLLLGWTVLVPAMWIYWVMRAKTTVGEEGIAIRYAFRGSKTISWDEFEGVGFKVPSLLPPPSGQQYNLPGVTFNSLPGLYDASRGRIPDALSEGKAAADEKVVVVHRDGQQMIMSKRRVRAVGPLTMPPRAYQAKLRATQAPSHAMGSPAHPMGHPRRLRGLRFADVTE